MTRKARNSQVAEQAHLEGAGVEHLHGEHRDGEHGQLGTELAKRVADEQLAEVVVPEQPAPSRAAAPVRRRYPGGGARGGRGFDGHAQHPDPLIGNYQSVGPKAAIVSPWTAPSARDERRWSRRRTARCRWVRPAGSGLAATPTRPRPRRSPPRSGCGSCAATLHEPRTNKEIAEVLGLNPASVLHHVRTLVDTGFLIEQPIRRGAAGFARAALPGLGQVASTSRPARAGLAAAGPAARDVPPGDQGAAGGPAGQRPAGLPAHAPRTGAGAGPAAGRARGDRGACRAIPEGEPWSLYLGLHPDPSGVPSAHDVDRDH